MRKKKSTNLQHYRPAQGRRLAIMPTGCDNPRGPAVGVLFNPPENEGENSMAQILNVVDIQAPIDKVHTLVATGEGIAQWWTPTVSDDAHNRLIIQFGDDWRLLLEQREVSSAGVRWRIVEHNSDEWVGTELVFRLSHSDGWTTLEFDHTGWARPTSFFRFCSTKWPTFLLSIKQAAETGVGAPYPNEQKIGRV